LEQLVQAEMKRESTFVGPHDSVLFPPPRGEGLAELPQVVPRQREILIRLGHARATDVDAARGTTVRDEHIAEREIAVRQRALEREWEHRRDRIPHGGRGPPCPLVVEVRDVHDALLKIPHRRHGDAQGEPLQPRMLCSDVISDGPHPMLHKEGLSVDGIEPQHRAPRTPHQSHGTRRSHAARQRERLAGRAVASCLSPCPASAI